MTIIDSKVDLAVYDNKDKSLIYKFMPFSIFALQLLINKNLYFANPKFLNDPLDCYTDVKVKNRNLLSQEDIDILFRNNYFLPMSIKFYKHNMSLFKDLSMQKALVKDLFVHDTNEFYGIASFSFTISNDLLWSHYSDGAKGLCVAFNKDELLRSIARSIRGYGYNLYSDFVRYSNKHKMLEIEFVKGGYSSSKKHLFTKKSDWRYEKEFRIILNKKNKLFHPDSPDYFRHFIPFSPSSVHSIIIGERMERANLELLKNLLTAEKSEYHLHQYKMSY